MGHFIDAFLQYADFKTRATRKQYWMFILIYMLFAISLSIIDIQLGTLYLGSILDLILFVPSISIAARRLHDIGRSGWWQLIILVPLIGLIILIYFYCKGSDEENQFGDVPQPA